MNEREEIEGKLWDFFTCVLADTGFDSYPVIFENENGTRPKPPYCSIAFEAERVLGTTPYLNPRMTKVGEGYVESFVAQIERECVLRGFSKAAENALNAVYNLLQFETYINKLKQMKIVIKNVEAVRESSQDFSSTTETFFSMNFTVAYGRLVTNENEYISAVGISTDGLFEPDGSMTGKIDMEIQEESNGRPD